MKLDIKGDHRFWKNIFKLNNLFSVVSEAPPHNSSICIAKAMTIKTPRYSSPAVP